MQQRIPGTAVAAFAAAVQAHPTQPLITFYDDGTAERTELSAATLANWTAKTANLLVDGCGLGTGDQASVLLPAHWQTAVVLLGCWSAGLAVDLDGTTTARSAITFVATERIREAIGGEVFGLSLAPMGGPFRAGPPPGVRDYVVEVRGQADQFSPMLPVGPQTLALADGRSHGDLVAAAAMRASAAGLRRSARVLVDGDAHPDPLDWLLAPLVAGATIVLCRHLAVDRLAARLATERATVHPPSS